MKSDYQRIEIFSTPEFGDVLVLDDKEAAEHVLEIRVKEEGKKGTITAIGLQ